MAPPDPVSRHLPTELRNLARLAAQWADVLDRDCLDPKHGHERCPSCGFNPYADQASLQERAPEPVPVGKPPAPDFYACPRCTRPLKKIQGKWRCRTCKKTPNDCDCPKPLAAETAVFDQYATQGVRP